MKLVFATFFVGVVGILCAMGSCSVSHRSGEFTSCDRQSDCPANEICSDSICVPENQGGSDGGVNPDGKPDAGNQCPTQCTSCKLESKTCIVDCAVSAATCNSPITCPEGFNCDIRCTTGNSCRNGIDCQNAESCAVTCSGQASCRNVACGAGKCEVNCSGLQACRGIACGPSCACDVTCANQALCESVTCTFPQCDSFDGGCVSQFPGCNTCGM